MTFDSDSVERGRASKGKSSGKTGRQGRGGGSREDRLCRPAVTTAATAAVQQAAEEDQQNRNRNTVDYPIVFTFTMTGA